jgi:hypothetical protein
MITHKKIEAAISEAENSFNACWEKLVIIRKCSAEPAQIRQAILSFQPTLSICLFKLESLYAKVCKEVRDLGNRKARLNKVWLRRRIERLNGFKHILRQSMDIGRMLGDSFAWVFYKGNRDLLRKHHAQEANPHSPIGIGGRGEVEFVQRIPKFGRYLVLAHSITTFLRLGDLSLIDPDGLTVVAIGELKTKAESDTNLKIKLILIGSSSRPIELPQPPAKMQESEPVRDEPLPPELQERLDRQIVRMKESFRPPDKNRTLPPVKAEVNAPSTHSKLLELYRQSSYLTWGHVKADRGLLILGIRHRGDSLHKRLTTMAAAINNRNLSRVGAATKEILNSGLQHNNVRLGWVGYPARVRYALRPGMEPLFWWPLNIEVTEALLFKRFSVMTIYNPAFLIDDLRHSGLEVEPLKDGQIRVWKKAGTIHYEVKGMSFFMRLIQECLVPDISIALAIQKFAESVEKAGFKHSATVDMHLDFNIQ